MVRYQERIHPPTVLTLTTVESRGFWNLPDLSSSLSVDRMAVIHCGQERKAFPDSGNDEICKTRSERPCLRTRTREPVVWKKLSGRLMSRHHTTPLAETTAQISENTESVCYTCAGQTLSVVIRICDLQDARYIVTLVVGYLTLV